MHGTQLWQQPTSKRITPLRLFVVFSALMAFVFVVTPACADDPVISDNGHVVEVRIERPVVTQRSTLYPTVTFIPGDTVEVAAGGCVQTGGAGKTWKRYVDPSGDNSDRLYHGRIRIASATIGLQPIKGVIANSPVVVLPAPPGADPNLFVLELGYDDDNYDDNGYYDHDDGTENQCQNLDDAFIQLTITHPSGNGPAPVPQLPKAPMDLWWSAVDDNVLPLNPDWGMQVNSDGTTNGRVPDAGQLCNNFHDEGDNLQLGNPSCTTQSPTVDEPSVWSDPAFWTVCQASGGVAGAVHGHINWGLATYTGKLFFTDHSNPVPSGLGDDDYDMTLQRADQASATVGNDAFSGQDPRRSLGLEFDSDETIDYFDTPWWSSFHQTVDGDSSWAAAKGMIDGADAIVTGLIGMDNKHGAHAELHPVLGLMARIPSHSTSTSDFWVFFARPEGDEGGCSQDLHQFSSTTTMQFLLPLPAAQKPTIANSNIKERGQGGWWSATTYPDGLLVTIHLPSPQSTTFGVASPLMWGELTINHAGLADRTLTGKSQVGSLAATRVEPIKPTPSPTQNKKAIILVRPKAQSVFADRDDYLGPIKAKLSPAEWQKFEDAYQHPPAEATLVVNHAFYISRKSFENSPTQFARFNLANAGRPLAVTATPVPRTSTPGVRRSRALSKTEPRIMSPGARIANRALLLQHQLVAQALRVAVGPVRAEQILQPPPTGVRPKPANSAWVLPELKLPAEQKK